jgi:hypothetical protein
MNLNDWKNIMLSLEQRIKRIEDELGFTEQDERKRNIKDARSICEAYGFAKKSAKEFAWHMINENGLTASQVEELLIARGGKKV